MVASLETVAHEFVNCLSLSFICVSPHTRRISCSRSLCSSLGLS